MLFSTMISQASIKLKRKELSRYQAYGDSKRKACPAPSGSLTVEAAFILPFFLMVTTALLLLFELMVFQIKLQGAIDYAASRAAAYYYAIETAGSEKEENTEKIGNVSGFGIELIKNGISAIYLKNMVLEQMEESIQRAGWLSDGKDSFTVLGSRFPDEQGAIQLVMSYEAKIPFLPKAFGTIRFSQSAKRMVWSGSRRWNGSDQETEERKEEYVYITETGSVYHVTQECSYLKLSIQSVNAASVASLRNSSGGKYYACERCKSTLAGYILYVTKDGDRYHTTLSCSAISRNIRKVKKSEVENRRACSRCGSH